MSRPTVREEFGPLLRWVARGYFRDVRFSQEDDEQWRSLHEKGFVVHVMRTTGWINYLYLAWALLKRELPPIRAVVNLRRWFTKPWRKAAQRGDFDVRFTYARRQGGSGLIFLRNPVFLSSRGRRHWEDPFPSLVAMARKSERPVFLLPELFVWEKAREKLRPNLWDYLFGSPEAPGPLHTLVAFWRNYQRAQFRVGEPVELKDFIALHPEDSDPVLARKVRSALHHHLARETRAVFGPPVKPVKRLIEETLRDPVLQDALGEVSAKTGRRFPGVVREARRDLETIAARQSPTTIAFLAPVLTWVFNRIYDGIDVDEASLTRAMKAGARAPLVLCASHKSHVDYLVLAYLLWMRGYRVPLVAAGANLSFFPLGSIFRRGGAFFLRRSFKDDRIYAASFRAYLKKLIADGIPQEFFPEGTRSRTGKLLMPKLGLFTWQVDAFLEGASSDVMFLPVAMDYEKVVESRAYTRELAGGDKKAEDIKGLLAAPKVLAHRYGRIHVAFEEPISLVELMKARGLEPGQAPGESSRKSLVRALGHKVMYGISQASTITPHALAAAALLGGAENGAAGASGSASGSTLTSAEGSEEELVSLRAFVDRMGMLRQIAGEEGARLSTSLQNAPSDPTVLGPVRDAVGVFAKDGLVQILESPPGQVQLLPVQSGRAELSFYKNTLLNLVVGRVLVAQALLAEPLAQASVATLRAQALFLSRLFKLEFTYPTQLSFGAIFDQAVEKLVRQGLLVAKEDRLQVAPESFALPQLRFLANLIRDYLECYLLAARGLEQLAEGPLEKKAWLRGTLELGRQALAQGPLQLPEALSKPTLENALAFFLDQDLVREEKKRLFLSGRFLEPDQRERFQQEIRRFLLT